MGNSTIHRNPVLSAAAKAFAILALLGCLLMLARDLTPGAAWPPWTGFLSALPLLAIGLSFLVVQMLARQQRSQLLKNLLLAATFLLWGVVELFPDNTASRILGEVVIALFVVDLAWTILPRVSDTRNPFE
jgi:hypothetical protein